MKRLITLGLVLQFFIVVGGSALAEARAPQVVVVELIQALQRGDMELVGKHAALDRIKASSAERYTADSLKKLFASVDVAGLKFSTPEFREETGAVVLRLVQPLELGFELRHENKFTEPKNGSLRPLGDYFRVVRVFE